MLPTIGTNSGSMECEFYFIFYFYFFKRMMAITIPRKTKRGRPNKGQKTHSLKGPKRGREPIFLVVGSYFTHGPSNVACMQIVTFNSSGRSRTSITCQNNLPLYSKGKSTLEKNINMLLKKLNAKKKG